jgi:signal transduction histidine kinase/CheY-like chemotaxis protein
MNDPMKAPAGPPRAVETTGFRRILILSNVVLSIVALGSLAIVIGVPVRGSLISAVERRGDTMAADLAGRARLALAVGDTLRLAEASRERLGDVELIGIVYRDADGGELARFAGAGSSLGYFPGVEHLRSVRPIRLDAAPDADLFAHEAGLADAGRDRLGSVEVIMTTRGIITGLVRTFVLVALLVIGGLVLLVRAALRRFVDPVIRLAEAAQAVRDGQLDVRVDEHAPAELGALQSAFNRMVESLAVQKQSLRTKNDALAESLTRTEQLVEELKQTQDVMVRSEKLRAIGEMASGVAHGFNNVLAAITGRTQLMELKVRGGQLDAEYLLRGLDIVRQAAADGARTVQRLQQYTRGALQKELAGVDLERVARQAVDMARPRWSAGELAGAGPIDVTLSFAPGLVVAAEESDLREVILNLLYNATDAMPDGGTLSITGERRGERPAITVADTGEGIQPDILRRVFDPFFSTKGVKGNGLGLSIVSGIVKRFGGEVQVQSVVGEGSRFTVLLRPWEERVDAVSLAAERPGAAAARPGTAPGVPEAAPEVVPISCLIADDNSTALENLREILESLGHRVTALETGRGAVDALREGRFQIVITDLGMPEVNGWDVARAARKAEGSPPVVLCTGWGDTLDPAEIRARGVWQALTKPYTLRQVERILEELPAAS